MNRIMSALKRKIGPLPAWGWLAGLVGVLLLWRHFKGAGTSAQTVDTGYGSGTDYDLGGGSGGGSGSGGGQISVTPSSPTGSTTPDGTQDTRPTTTTSTGKTKPGTAAGFWWGGFFFRTAAQLKAWGSVHGWKPGDIDIWAAKHPTAAKSIGITPPPLPSGGASKLPTVGKPKKASSNEYRNAAREQKKTKAAAQKAARAASTRKPAAKAKTSTRTPAHNPKRKSPGRSPAQPFKHPVSLPRRATRTR